MKKIFLLLLPFVLIISTCEKDNTVPISDDPVTIPDTAFLSAIIDNGVDTDRDGIISYREAAAVDGLAIWGGGDIVNLDGIEAFINLKGLFFDGTGFSTINLSKNTKLDTVIIRVRPPQCFPVAVYNSGNLQTINISKNKKLISLTCTNQRVASLDISNNISLKEINIGRNRNLTKVCVWETPFPPAGVQIDTSNSPNVYFTNDCNE